MRPFQDGGHFQPPWRGWGYSLKFCMGRFCHKVQTLAFNVLILIEMAPLFTYLEQKLHSFLYPYNKPKTLDHCCRSKAPKLRYISSLRFLPKFCKHFYCLDLAAISFSLRCTSAGYFVYNTKTVNSPTLYNSASTKKAPLSVGASPYSFL